MKTPAEKKPLYILYKQYNGGPWEPVVSTTEPEYMEIYEQATRNAWPQFNYKIEKY